MASNITETIEMSRFFLKVFLEEGECKLQQLLYQYSQSIIFENKDVKDINSKLTMIVSGILSVLYGNTPEKLIREQLKVSEPFVSESHIENKIKIFTQTLVDYLLAYRKNKKENLFSDNVIEYIRTCSIKELANLTVESLAEYFGYGKSRFLAKIKPETGKTAQEVLSEERLARAYQLIKNEPQKTIKEISYLVGFTDSVYFSRLFKKTYKFLPSEVRNM